ncbi:MAG: hypothetical protein Q9184_005452 [Pyrenodesmia sp. 2 TL-2023]
MADMVITRGRLTGCSLGSNELLRRIGENLRAIVVRVHLIKLAVEDGQEGLIEAGGVETLFQRDVSLLEHAVAIRSFGERHKGDGPFDGIIERGSYQYIIFSNPKPKL